MTSIRRIVLSYGTHPAMVNHMLQDTLTQPLPLGGDRRSANERALISPWLNWRPKRRRPIPVLSVAELAECTCPDLCDRDHANE
jgi:hypothetical protein